MFDQKIFFQKIIFSEQYSRAEVLGNDFSWGSEQRNHLCVPSQNLENRVVIGQIELFWSQSGPFWQGKVTILKWT